MKYKNNKMKTIYVPMGADIFHSGHLNIINKAKKYGKIIIGLFSDKAITEYKRIPIINYEQRFQIINQIKNIHKIVKQDSWDYTTNLEILKPDYVIHGDDWKEGIQKDTRSKVIKTIKNGKVNLLKFLIQRIFLFQSSMKKQNIYTLTATQEFLFLKD